MAPRIPRVAIGQSRVLRLPIAPRNQQICPICSISITLQGPARRSQTQRLSQYRIQARRQSILSSAGADDVKSSSPSKPPRIELRDALLDLEKHAASYVNISRLQLALRGLEQETGQETIRVAILGIADGGVSLKKAKELLRLLIADPLKTEEEWERILVDDQDGSKPVFLKVGHNGSEETFQANRLVQEVHVSSPVLNGHKLEILVLEMDPPVKEDGDRGFAEAVLVPTMEIPTSNTGRYTPITTPVHKTLLVAEGILGAASVLNYPVDLDRSIIGSAVDLRIGTPDEKSSLPFRVIDVSLGNEALRSFRQSVGNAFLYEQKWFASGIPEILEWIKLGTSTTGDGMKEPLRQLISSLLRNALLAIQAEQTRQLSAALSASLSSSDRSSLRQGLSQWAERAHTELRDQLDIAFNGHRWRKLGWWKLFWRVDDVSMIASDILNQRFLTDAEKEIIFLAGGIAEAGVFKNIPDASAKNWAYKPIQENVPDATLGSKPPPPQIQDLLEPSNDLLPAKVKPRPWPLHIPVTRAYLAQETVPALQALAQKLVLQTITTSSVVSAFAGLMYISSITTGLYEVGGVAAFGIVWSLRRMQDKWETARKFWEGEVREEGRKSVRAVEGVVSDVLQTPKTLSRGDIELEMAKESVERAESALAARK